MEVYDPKYKFDELGDVAFAEIRIIMDRMERNKEIEVESLSCEEMAYECKKLACEFMEKYDAACELGEFPDFYGTLDMFAYKNLTEKFPPLKTFDVLIDGVCTMKYRVEAKDEDEANELADKFIQSDKFFDHYRKDADFFEINIGDTTEVKEEKA